MAVIRSKAPLPTAATLAAHAVEAATTPLINEIGAAAGAEVLLRVSRQRVSLASLLTRYPNTANVAKKRRELADDDTDMTTQILFSLIPLIPQHNFILPPTSSHHHQTFNNRIPRNLPSTQVMLNLLMLAEVMFQHITQQIMAQHLAQPYLAMILMCISTIYLIRNLMSIMSHVMRRAIDQGLQIWCNSTSRSLASLVSLTITAVHFTWFDNTHFRWRRNTDSTTSFPFKVCPVPC
jgi:hypothetical protein